MQKMNFDPIRSYRWRATRRRIAIGSPSERATLLTRFGDEIRSLIPLVVRASRTDWDLASCFELSTALGVIVGGWLAVDPRNPEWPGRDRLYLCRRQDWIAACSVLSLSGFFPPEYVGRMVDSLETEKPSPIPGIEMIGQPSRLLAKAAWDSALESNRSKRRWRENFSDNDNLDWVEPIWRNSNAVWHTCIVLDHEDESLPAIRNLAAASVENPAGLLALISVPRDDALLVANQWRECGWETLVVSRNDPCELYSCLCTPSGSRPIAIMLTFSDEPEMPSTGTVRRGESMLIGELPDDQFNALMDATLQF